MRHAWQFRHAWAWGATACAALAAWPAPAAAGTVRLWRSAVVTGEAVTVGDVATFAGFDEGLRQRLADVPLAPRPAAGQVLVIRSDDVRAALDGLGVNWAEVTLLGAARCEVTAPAESPRRRASPSPLAERPARPAAPHRPRAERRSTNDSAADDAARRAPAHGDAAWIRPAAANAAERSTASADGQTLADQLTRYVDEHLARLGGRAEVRFGAAHRGLLSLRSPECRFSIRPQGDAPLGMVWFDVGIERAGQKPQSAAVLAEVSLLRPVVVAARVINRGQEIAARDLRMEERPFRRLDDVGLTDLSLAVGMEARRAIRPGETLLAKDVQAKALVRRNQLVTVWSRVGGVIVHSAGRVARDGWLGDEVEVRAEGSEERITATVTGPGTVSAGADARWAMSGRPSETQQ